AHASRHSAGPQCRSQSIRLPHVATQNEPGTLLSPPKCADSYHLRSWLQDGQFRSERHYEGWQLRTWASPDTTQLRPPVTSNRSFPLFHLPRESARPPPPSGSSCPIGHGPH